MRPRGDDKRLPSDAISRDRALTSPPSPYHPRIPTTPDLALLPQGRGFDRGPPHGVPAVHDPRPPREAGRQGVPGSVELDRSPPRRLPDVRVPPRDAPLRQGPALRLPGDNKKNATAYSVVCASTKCFRLESKKTAIYSFALHTYTTRRVPHRVLYV